jgi:hypothetical protein
VTGDTNADRFILLVQPEEGIPAWWPRDEDGDLEVVTLDPEHPGGWRLGEDPDYAFSAKDEEDGIVEALIDDWLESQDEDSSWEFVVMELGELAADEHGARDASDDAAQDA